MNNHTFAIVPTTLILTMQVIVFANGLGDQDSIPGRVIPKTQKMVLDAFLLNTRQYKVIFTNPSARAGYDTRSIFKRSLTGFNSEISYS